MLCRLNPIIHSLFNSRIDLKVNKYNNIHQEHRAPPGGGSGREGYHGVGGGGGGVRATLHHICSPLPAPGDRLSQGKYRRG